MVKTFFAGGSSTLHARLVRTDPELQNYPPNPLPTSVKSRSAPIMAMGPSPSEPRPYVLDELKGLRKDRFVQLVLAQIEHWPPNANGRSVTKGQIGRKTRMEVLIAELLRKENGFTTTKRRPNPPTTSVHAPPSASPTNSASSMGPPSAPTPESPLSNTSQSTIQLNTSLFVFIRDLHPGLEERKGIMAEVLVPCLMDQTGQPAYIVPADAMKAIQETSTAIHGQMLRYPPQGNLFLIINKRCEDAELQSTTSVQSNISDEDHPEKQRKGKGKTKGNVRSEVVQKLRDRLEETEGYETYKERIRHRLLNPQVVEQWRSMCRFYDEHSSMQATRTGSSKGLRAITQAELAEALACSVSSLKNALSGYRMAERYGRYGQKLDQRVIDELERTHGPKQGSIDLKDFLDKYEAGHHN
ncbi:hypothetical protein V5O48_006558 [Marasmius crinis-equi]|uniref:Uncharacterized protein n=1 Tax=Marasmius crinis-equi TaxID=585013 RepID=A0ABR3FJE5_9AGAR